MFEPDIKLALRTEEKVMKASHRWRWVNVCLSVVLVMGVIYFAERKHDRSQHSEQIASSLTVNRAPKHWRLAFADNFSGVDGSLPSRSKWLIYSGQGYAYELERYSASVTNVRLDGHGHLELIARRVGGTWTSGEVQSKESFEASKGTSLLIEARVELPSGGQGYWPA